MVETNGETVTFPGARAPDRQRWVDSQGVQIRVHEWGDEGARPLMCVHGGFDFARTFDAFAPLLADAGWRVVAWDHRGHGDSEHAALYSWEADVRDAMAVIDSTTREPVPVIAHSKGGSMLLTIAEIFPHRLWRFVNIDGMPSPKRHLDVQGHERTLQMEQGIKSWIEHRRKVADAIRKPGTIDELAKRRGRMNPRLSHDWLRYLVTVGARHDVDGWRWKIDPAMRFGGFGPWRHTWAMAALPAVSVPLLGLLGLIPEEMGWGTQPGQLEPYLPSTAKIVYFSDTGHFVHIEKSREVADHVLDFLS
ncbi:MAG: alpha/beta hydrolase [Actinomycetota bacterium]